jgi:hypothetical protein
MLVNFQAENSVAHSINLLLSGVIYGQYSSGGVFIVQVVFAVFNILSIVYLISLLAVELSKVDLNEDSELVRTALEL